MLHPDVPKGTKIAGPTRARRKGCDKTRCAARGAAPGDGDSVGEGDAPRPPDARGPDTRGPDPRGGNHGHRPHGPRGGHGPQHGGPPQGGPRRGPRPGPER
jgi:hypothetical protein